MWSNKYIGIPYLDNGRDTAGTDCWGLVRLIYKEELAIDLPSFYTDYAVSDTERISELMSQYQEGWEQLSLPEEKCVVLFRILGKISHIGIMLNERQFIHTRKNQQASIESIDSIKWKNRVVGYYKYNENAKELFDAAPHALKATELVIQFDKEFTIADAFDAAYENAEIPEDLKKRIIVFVEGKQVDKEKDGSTFLSAGQKIEYRLVPDGEDFGRTLLTILVIVVAVKTGMWIQGGGMAGAAGAGTLAAGSAGAATAGYLAQAGVMMVGMALVNAIAPIRPMDMASMSDASAGSSNPQLLLTGARNDARQYESIPVVLGTYRYVPPVAAVNFLTVDTDNSYLRMLLCWGYGPLRVDKSSLRVGATDFNQYLDLDANTYISEASEVSSEDTTIPEALSTYGTDISQQSPNIELPFTPSVGDPLVGTPELDTVYRTISEDITALSISLHFPQGLRGIYKTGASAGGTFPVAFTFEVRARKLNPDTLLPDGAWFPPGTSFYAQPVYPTIGLAKSSVINNGFNLLYWSYAPGYTTSIIYLTEAGAIAVLSGPACTSSGATTGITGGSFPQIGFDGTRNSGGAIYSTTPVYTTAPAVPAVPAGGTLLYTVKTLYTNADSFSVLSTVDTRVANGITDGDITSTTTTNSKITLNLAAGGRPSSTGNFTYGLLDQPYYLRKDAFTDTVNFNLDVNNAAPYEISIRRTSSKEFDFTDRYEYKLANLFLITGQNAQVAAVKPPKNTTLTLSGLRIKATDQLNGSIEGISAQVSSLCKDYNTTTNLWSTDVLPTSNPAALFRYVLQHPANIQAVAEADINTKLDLPAIEDWYEFCETEGLTYNAVITQRRSLLEVMRDICAAGKASPMLINGKWSVIIDRPRTTLVQHFTPHNSWGFEGTRVLSTPPHALRVNVVSATKDYQTQELTVYSYSSKVMQVTTTAGSPTATVTSTIPIYPVAAEYTTDPAKRVTVTKSTSIPVNTTIVSITNATTFVLSANATTTGTTSVTFNVPYYPTTATIFETISLPGVTDEEQAINLAKFHLAQALLRPEAYSINTDMEHLACNRGDLVRHTHDVPMWGTATGRIKNFISTTSLELSEEVPMDAGINYTIRIRTATGASVIRNLNPVGVSGYYQTITLTATLTSLEGAANNLFMLGTLNSDSAEMIITGIEPSSNLTARINLVDYSPAVYTSNALFNALPSYNTQITSPTAFFSKYISSIPVVPSANIRSDESVMELSGSSYVYKISVPFSNPAGLEKTVTDLEYRMCLTSDTSKSWRTQGYVKLSSGSILLSDVIEGLSYSIQLRYVSSSGFTGPWCAEVTHTIVGKTTVPGAVTGFTAITAGADIKLSWTKSPEIDVVGYEIRTTNSGWGTAGSVFTGNVTTCTATPAAYGVLNTYYIKALDAANLYSTAASTSITVSRPGNIAIVGSPVYSSISTGQASVTMTWSAPTVSSTQLAARRFLITVTRPILGNLTFEASSNTTSATFAADWEGTATFNVITVDLGGNQSTTFSSNIVKVAPSVPTAAGTPVAVTGKAITINWTPSTLGSLPIAGYQLSTSNADPKITAYLYKGNVSSIDLGTFVKAPNTWYLWAYDTAGKYSATALTISRTFAGASAPVVSTPVLRTSTAYFKWTTPASDFAIATYNVSLVASGMTTITATISTTEWEVAVPSTWNNVTATISVTAVDVAGFTGAIGTNTIAKNSPSQVAGGVAANITLAYASTGTGQIATVDWAAPTVSANQLAIKHYLVTITKPSLATVNYTIPGTVITTDADWEGTATISITAVDTAGVSGTALVKSLIKVAPSVPGTAVTPVTISGKVLTLNWTSAAASSLPVAGYQLSTFNTDPKTTASLYKGNVSSIDLGTFIVGTNTWYLWAYDTAGKYSATPLTISKTVAATNAPVVSVPVLEYDSVLFKWATPTASDFVVDYYLVTFAVPGMTSLTARLSTTEWKVKVPAIWNNNVGTIIVTPVDIANLTGTTGTNTLTKVPPGQVSGGIAANITLAYASTGTGQIATIDWAEPTIAANQLAIKNYIVTITKPVIGTITYTSVVNSVITTNADWEGTGTISITSVDMAGISGTAIVKDLVKVAPSAPSAPLFAVKDSSAVLSWTSAAAGSLPVAGYQLSTFNTAPATNAYLYKGSASSITLNSVTASNTWYLFAYDTAGKYSTALTVSKSFVVPGVPTNLAAVFTASAGRFTWTAPATGDFVVARYNLTLTAAGMTTVTATLSTTYWEVPVTWTNTTATLTITATDIAGFTGASAQVTLQKTDPTAPGIPVVTVINTDIDVDWTDNTVTATQLSIKSYEIKTSAGVTVWRGAGSKALISLIGKARDVVLNYNIFAYDYNDVVSAARAFAYTPVAPTNIAAAPSLTASFGNSLTDATLTLNWITPSTLYGVAGYEVTYDSSTVTISSNTLTISPIPTAWTGNKTFTIKTIDLLGNKSNGTSIVVNKQVPGIVTGYSAQVIDNNVMIYWNLPERTSLPIISTRIKKGPVGSTWANATPVGDKNGTFTTIFELTAGTYTYWMAAIDTDKQESTPISFPVTVSQPPDFVFNGQLTSSLTGAELNSASTTDKAANIIVSGNSYTDITTNTWKVGRSTLGLLSRGKYYWEVSIDKGLGTNQIMLGITNSTAILTNYPGFDTNGYGYYGNNGNSYNNGVATAGIATFTTGDVIGLYLDSLGNTLTYYKNNILQRTVSVTSSTIWYPAVALFGNVGDKVTVNYGGTPFVYTPPNGANGCTNAIPDRVNNRVILPVDNTVQYASHFTNIRVLTMALSAGGTGYAVGDTFRLNTGTVNGTDYAVGVVATVSSGVVTGITIQNGGSYSVTPTLAAGATTALSGTGTGLTITVTTGGNWATPSAQVTAGFPVYIQPTLASGYYEEVLDYGTTLNSSQITLTIQGSSVAGAPVINTGISTSNDNITYSSSYSGSSLFATNFRYVKVRVTASETDMNKGLYALTYLSLKLDSKILDDSGFTACLSTDTDGTLANFGKEFVDVSAVSVTPSSGVTPLYGTYDFKDTVIDATYVVTSNVCTVTTSLAHGFSANALGQKVRLSFNSGTAPNGVYVVTGVSSTTVFTVSIVTANTSGTLTEYSQGMRIYLYNSSGVRASGNVSWAIRGN